MKQSGLLLLILLVMVLALSTDGQDSGGLNSAGHLFVDVSGADYIQVIQLATRRVVDKIVVGEHPHGLAWARGAIDGQTYECLYVTVEGTGELVIVDARSHKIRGRVRVGRVPNQLTVTRDGRFAYVPLRAEAKVAVVELGAELKTELDPKTGNKEAKIEHHPKVIKQIPIGEWPHNAYTGATTGRIYVTSFLGKKIHVFDPNRHELLFEIQFPGEVRPVVLTRDERRAYVAQSGFHGFLVADIEQRKVVARVELPPLPPDTPEPYLNTYVHGLTLSPDERELWVASCPGAAVYVYSLPDLKLQAKVPTGKFPHWFAWQPPPSRAQKNNEGWLLWVSQMDSNEVSALNPTTRKVVATVPTGPAPRRIVTDLAP